jgi:hypothetical protein
MRAILRVGLVAAAMLAGAGCDVPQQATDETACTTICRCFGGLPSTQDDCVTGCLGQLAPVSDSCAACVNEHATACDSLVPDCTAACSSATPLEALQGEPR